ncbi:MAG TPA: ferritin-like domain-containing protein [Thiohalobacter sp.]|nr:ferritin-like domain-containing protein [Thiohalobacter sp.]
MEWMMITQDKPVDLPRRRFMFSTVAASLSGITVAMLAGRPGIAAAAGQGDEATEMDVRILNTALAAEREAVAAYQVGADSGLLSTGVTKVALAFQGHHKQHADVLAGTIGKLGGTVQEPRSVYDFPVDSLNSEADVLKFAAGLERGAVSAYAGAIPLFENRELSKAAASILADEAMHWAVLRQALGLNPVPGAFFS